MKFIILFLSLQLTIFVSGCSKDKANDVPGKTNSEDKTSSSDTEAPPVEISICDDDNASIEELILDECSNKRIKEIVTNKKNELSEIDWGLYIKRDEEEREQFYRVLAEKNNLDLLMFFEKYIEIWDNSYDTLTPFEVAVDLGYREIALYYAYSTFVVEKYFKRISSSKIDHLYKFHKMRNIRSILNIERPLEILADAVTSKEYQTKDWILKYAEIVGDFMYGYDFKQDAVMAENHVKRSLLEIATYNTNIVFISKLLIYDDDLDSYFPNPRFCPINVLIYNNSLEGVELYLSARDSKILKCGESIRDPLIEAIAYSRIEILRLLISYGMNINSLHEGYTDTLVTPLDLADTVGNKEVIDLLKSNGALRYKELADGPSNEEN